MFSNLNQDQEALIIQAIENPFVDEQKRT